MAGGATFGKQLWRRFALIEILRNSHRSAERDYRRNNKQTAARFHWRHQFFRYTERMSRLGKKGGRRQVQRAICCPGVAKSGCASAIIAFPSGRGAREDDGYRATHRAHLLLNMAASSFPAAPVPPPSTTQDRRQSAETRVTAPCRPRRSACRLRSA